MRLHRLLPLLFLGSLACIGGRGDGKPGLLDDKDVDGDGYRYDEDCDDEDPDVNPGAAEKCDPHDVDEDCNGRADSDDDDPQGGLTVFHDADGDGFGDVARTACESSAAYPEVGGDCDDADPSVNPDALERCDPDAIDEDCDTQADDDDPDHLPGDEITVYVDRDGDGYGDPDQPVQRCHVAAGWAIDDTDCDDDRAAVHPAAAETCDGRDDDCDGDVDEDAPDAATWFTDADGDGFGDVNAPIIACDRPADAVADATDCDDAHDTSSPRSVELCDRRDNDCDGTVDEDDASDADTWYADADGDGYGDPLVTVAACAAPAGYTSDSDDCDDGDAAINLPQTEVCDPLNTDEDCDGDSDDEDRSADLGSMLHWHFDADRDGYGDDRSVILACDGSYGIIADGSDCDDTDAAISPAAQEICDADDTDEDCDGATDDADPSATAASMTVFYADADGDGEGTSAGTSLRCDASSGFADNTRDCDDADALRATTHTEICDAADRDEDCDALSDDDDPSVDPASLSTWYDDADGDGFGGDADALQGCELPSGALTTGGDCDDADAAVNPNGTEVCFDGVDGNCDGVAGCAVQDIDADIVYSGTRYSGAGTVVGSAGDQNQDGIDDLLISGDYVTTEVFLSYGGATADVDLANSDAQIYATGNDYSGMTMAMLGDLDGDGVDDVALGEDTWYSSYGAAYVRLGPITGMGQVSNWDPYTTVGRAADDRLGAALAAGDVDDDGRTDLLIGAPGRANGTVYLEAGWNSGFRLEYSLSGVRSGDEAGNSLAAADFDGDGIDDVLVGAPSVATSTGAAYVVAGPVSGTVSLTNATATLNGAAAGDEAGVAVAAGDHDGDGYADAVIGAPGYGPTSAVFVVDGPIRGTSALSAASTIVTLDYAAGYGISLAANGDMNGDGRDDLAIGNPSDGTGGSTSGMTLVFYGPLSASATAGDAEARIQGSRYLELSGISVAFVGAQDGTAGVSDLLIGASSFQVNGASAGGAFLFDGAR